MARISLAKLELRIMEAVWKLGPCSVREILEAFPEKGRPAYTTIQTTVYRLENKGALRCVKRISNANIFEAAISRDEVGKGLLDDLLALFGGGTKPVMAHLIESGKLTLDDMKEAEDLLREHRRKGKTRC
ncbi:MAG: BlaI/MecI/CopY family transcriptional regulator [Acidobacteriia bacterium]|nr:BlaI/MecI/CopY family transcriptional regulator [Terriglobia bacterium]